jgi:hypothetical protein
MHYRTFTLGCGALAVVVVAGCPAPASPPMPVPVPASAPSPAVSPPHVPPREPDVRFEVVLTTDGGPAASAAPPPVAPGAPAPPGLIDGAPPGPSVLPFGAHVAVHLRVADPGVTAKLVDGRGRPVPQRTAVFTVGSGMRLDVEPLDAAPQTSLRLLIKATGPDGALERSLDIRTD